MNMMISRRDMMTMRQQKLCAEELQWQKRLWRGTRGRGCYIANGSRLDAMSSTLTLA